MYISEVTASLYPWDLADEGVDTCLNNVTNFAGANSVYLIGLMHWEKRPLTDLFYPHNPVRKYYVPENSRIYYNVPEEAFKGMKLKPLKSERDFLKGIDWLDKLSTKARERELKVGVELSHTIYDTQKVLKEQPELLQQNVKGNPIDGWYLCINNPDVREYIKTLFYQTALNHDVDFIQTCLFQFASGNTASIDFEFRSEVDRLLHIVNGGCFCPECRKKALEMGYDWDSIIRDVEHLYDINNAADGKSKMEKQMILASNLTGVGILTEFPYLYKWLEFRIKSVTSLTKDIYDSIKNANNNVEFRYNSCFHYQELMGLSHKAICDYVDSVRDSDYSEQSGNIKELYRKKQQLLKVRRGIGFDKKVLAAIGIRPKAMPEIIIESIRQLSELGIDGLSLGHYDGASFELLRAVKEGMEQADMRIL